MYYSIGEIAGKTGITVSTLRYYDKEGLLPTIGRSSGGIRVFTDVELNTIKLIECLKSTGLSIKDIKKYMDLYLEGDSTLPKRRDIFYERLAVMEQQQKEFEKTMAMLKFKCWYYDTAIELGSEDFVKNKSPEDLPEEIKKLAEIIFE